MNLKTLNPKVYEMWEVRRSLGEDYFQPSTPADIKAIEAEIGSALPDDYKEFLLEYSTVGAIPKIGAYYFKCDFKNESVISFNHTLVPWAKLTLTAIRSLHNQHEHFGDIGPRVPRELLPLTRDNNATLLIDLRPETFGNVLYLPEIKRQTFGSPGYGWDNIGYTATSFTAFLADLDTEDNQISKYKLPVR